MADYIPTQDPDFNNWAKNFASYVNANFAALGLTAAQNTSLQNAITDWTGKYGGHVSAHAAANAATQAKDISRTGFETIARGLAHSIQANLSATKDQKAAAGLTVRKETKTPLPKPTTRPMADIDNKKRLEHTIHYFDEGNSIKKAKPFGVMGCELWLKIGGAEPAGPSEVTYVAIDTKTPYRYQFAGADGGKTAHWMLRWINKRGEAGPWSETISVTISA
jgi:hypothetical protein